MDVNRHHNLSELEWLLQKVEIVRTAWKLVLISFLSLSIIGCVALYATTRPKYSSHMVLPLTPNMQALIYTDAVLAPVSRNTRAPTANMFSERQSVASRLLVSELKKGSGLFSITVTDDSPQDAKALLEQILAQIAVVSKPTGTALLNAQQEIGSLKRALTELKELSAAFKENASRTKGGTEGDLDARSFVTLISDIVTKEQRIRELENYLEGIAIGDVAVPPSLASRSDPTGLSRKIAFVLLVSLVAPISFVLLRDLWRNRHGSSIKANEVQRAA